MPVRELHGASESS